MRPFDARPLRRFACAAAALGLTACASGAGSFLAGSGGDPESDTAAAEEEAQLLGQLADPDLLVVGGNALLPGSRASGEASSASLLGQAPGEVAGGLAAAAAPVNPLTGPLLSLNGTRNAFLGLPVGVTALGSAVQADAGVGASVNPTTATTQLLVSVGAAVTSPIAPGGGVETPAPTTPPVTTPPVVPPVTPPVTTPLVPPGVPGSTPLNQLTGLLTNPVQPPTGL